MQHVSPWWNLEAFAVLPLGASVSFCLVTIAIADNNNLFTQAGYGGHIVAQLRDIPGQLTKCGHLLELSCDLILQFVFEF